MGEAGAGGAPTGSGRVLGAALGPPTVRSASAEDPTSPSDVDENSWLVWDLRPERCAKGMHEIKVILVERDPRMRPCIVVNNVEFWVSYSQ